MNSVCARAHNQPISGHCRTSDLATKRIGITAFSTKTSSQEMWLVTMMPERNACIDFSAVMLTFRMLSNWADQRRSMRRRTD